MTITVIDAGSWWRGDIAIRLETGEEYRVKGALNWTTLRVRRVHRWPWLERLHCHIERTPYAPIRRTV